MITPVVSEVPAAQDSRRRDYAERSQMAHGLGVAPIEATGAVVRAIVAAEAFRDRQRSLVARSLLVRS